jgi:hypothetical protein
LTIIPSLTRAVLAAIAVTVCVAYLSGGARGIGVSDRDRVFSPADSADLQVEMPARDVPIDQLPTISNLTGRFALAIALGRRSALRDLAAVAAALAVAAFGAWLMATGIPVFITALAMMAMAAGATFWGRGISWSFDALAPALICISLWLAVRGRRTTAIVIGAVALIDLQPWTGPEFGSSFGAFVAAFTPLGAFLIVIGMASWLAQPSMRRPVGVAAAVLIAWHLAGPRSPLDRVSIPLAIGGWTAAAAGLTWMQRVLSPRAGYVPVTMIALMVMAEPALTRERLTALGRDQPSEVRTRVASDVRPADLPEGAAVIAEAHRADVMLRLAATRAGRELPFVPQQTERVQGAAGQGIPLIAFDNARANLERLGFLFEREFFGNIEASLVAGHAPCLDLKRGEWQDVSLLIANGAFVLHGAEPGTAPGGMVLRAAKEPLQVSAIEPRSIPFEVHDTGLRVPATGRRDPVIVTLISAPAAAEATAEDGPPVRMCPGAQRGPLTLGRAGKASAALQMNAAAPFAAGWHPIEADPDFFRWTGAPEALVRVSLAQAGPVRVTLTATPAARASQKPSIGLIVNRCRLPQQSMQQGQGDYEWTVEASCWRTGMNHVWIAVTPLISPASLFKTHDNRLLGARIGAIRLAR